MIVCIINHAIDPYLYVFLRSCLINTMIRVYSDKSTSNYITCTDTTYLHVVESLVTLLKFVLLKWLASSNRISGNL